MAGSIDEKEQSASRSTSPEKLRREGTEGIPAQGQTLDPEAKKAEIVTTEATAVDDAEEDAQYPHGVKLWALLGALMLAVFLVALDQTIISTAIPKITDHFNSIKDIGW